MSSRRSVSFGWRSRFWSDVVAVDRDAGNDDKVGGKLSTNPESDSEETDPAAEAAGESFGPSKRSRRRARSADSYGLSFSQHLRRPNAAASFGREKLGRKLVVVAARESVEEGSRLLAAPVGWAAAPRRPQVLLGTLASLVSYSIMLSFSGGTRSTKCPHGEQGEAGAPDVGDAGDDGENEAGDSRPVENSQAVSAGSKKESLGRTRGDEHEEAEYEATARSERHMEGLGRFRLCFGRFGCWRWTVLDSVPLQHSSDLGEDDCSRGEGHDAAEVWCMSSSETILAAARTIPPGSLDPPASVVVDDAGLFQH